ncbi:restriction endonuclease [Micromonospora echinospora]|uniref:nSTAND3 domain-containing NTPase n=1 Tax=Micromonospora echinospora TaxID=1877 RepID=UPI003415AF9B
MENFEKLSDFDFEQVMADLLSAEWDATVEYFPRGRDGGVDLRVLGPQRGEVELRDGEELVVQCKHRPNANYQALKQDLKKEAGKPIVQTAARYVVVTSARLTRLNKKSIVTLFNGRVSERDILGRDDIARLLRKHPAVERAHLKLWLSSGETLSILLRQMENLRSDSLKTEIERLSATFVETVYLHEAMDRLERYGVCVLAGPPGVGKTTTARLLILRLMAQGWEPIAGVADVREIEAQMVRGKRQVLFLDDFLGQNSLEAKLRSGGESELLGLISAVQADRDKVFILTTRDYILKQAQQNYEKLDRKPFDVVKVSVSSTGLSEFEKSNILYNQLYYSALRPVARSSPSWRYLSIVRRSYFNPRLTETAIAIMVRELGLEPNRSLFSGTLCDPFDPQPAPELDIDVPARIEAALRDPEELWRHAIRYQFTPLQRAVLFVRASFGQRPVALDDLYSATESYAGNGGVVLPRMALDDALRVLDGDCFSVESQLGEIVVGPLNPGLADAVNTFLLKYDDVLLTLARNCQFFTQVRWVAGLTGTSGLIVERGQGTLAPRLAGDLLRAAERVLLKPAAKRTDQLFLTDSDPWHVSVGTNLSLVLDLMRLAGNQTSVALRGVIEAIIREHEKISLGDIEETLQFLKSPLCPPEWRPLKTELEHRTLLRFAEPGDLGSWKDLAEVLTFIEPAAEFSAETTAAFELYSAEKLDEMREILDENPEDFDEDELEALEAIADGLMVEIDTGEMRELLEKVDRSGAARVIPGQRALFDFPLSPGGEPPSLEEMFDHL